jgi:hypothetical protein
VLCILIDGARLRHGLTVRRYVRIIRQEDVYELEVRKLLGPYDPDVTYRSAVMRHKTFDELLHPLLREAGDLDFAANSITLNTRYTGNAEAGLLRQEIQQLVLHAARLDFGELRSGTLITTVADFVLIIVLLGVNLTLTRDIDRDTFTLMVYRG